MRVCVCACVPVCVAGQLAKPQQGGTASAFGGHQHLHRTIMHLSGVKTSVMMEESKENEPAEQLVLCVVWSHTFTHSPHLVTGLYPTDTTLCLVLRSLMVSLSLSLSLDVFGPCICSSNADDSKVIPLSLSLSLSLSQAPMIIYFGHKKLMFVGLPVMGTLAVIVGGVRARGRRVL